MASENVILFHVVSYCALLAIVQCSKLNFPHILLPIFKEVNTNFTLESVEEGCFKWSTTRTDLVALYPIYEDSPVKCSKKAVVSAIGRDPVRNVAVVLAEEVDTQMIVRVDVILDVIKLLKISTTTKEVIMNEVPERFQVVAFDSQGNRFTSLEGVEFNWQISTVGTIKNMSILRFLTFKESMYETPSSISTFEDKNKRGHIVLLEGIKTGSAKVQVQLPYEEYVHVNVCEVQLFVMANLLIIPAEVYVMPGDVVMFKLFSMNNGKMEELSFENSQYHLEVETTSVASMDRKTGQLTASREGTTKVILQDVNVIEEYQGLKSPSSIVNVVKPSFLTISLLPRRNWDILLFEHHDIVVEVHSATNNKLYLGSGVEIDTKVGENFSVSERVPNGTWISGWAEKVGVASVEATLLGVVHPRSGRTKIHPITATNNINIFAPIVLKPSEMYLPWDPDLKPKYEVEVSVSGGDGKFVWSSNDSSIGVVNQAGLVHSYSHGTFQVKAAMHKNPHNNQKSLFHILTPSRLEIVEYLNEAEIGTVIYLHVALYANKSCSCCDSPIEEVHLTKCQDLRFEVTTSDKKFSRDKKAQLILPVGISCGNVAVIGHQVGSSQITVTYKTDEITLKDTVTIGAFEPLELIAPKEIVVLAVGTSLNLVFRGGPQPHIGRLFDYKRTVVSTNNESVVANEVRGSQTVVEGKMYPVVNVLCRRLGESNVVLSVSNSLPLSNCKSKTVFVTVKVICGKPRSVSLQPHVETDDGDKCPMELNADKITVQRGKDVELDVIVRDENGVKFLNVTSLNFVWSSKPDYQVTFTAKNSVLPRNEFIGTINFGYTSYQVATPKIETGQVEVKAQVSGYHKKILQSYNIKAEWPEFTDDNDNNVKLAPITTTVNLYLVENFTVSPSDLLIYNHPMNKKTVVIKEGSGYFKLTLSNSEVAAVKLVEGSREIEVKPEKGGDLRIRIVDLCLVSKYIDLTVSVVSVEALHVQMSDKVEVGKCITCIVKLYDKSGNLLNLPDVSLVNLKHKLGSDIVSIKRETDDVMFAPEGEIHFVITGLEVGDTKLIFTNVNGKEDISSAPLDIQVFSALKVYPRNATVVMGSTLQFNYEGGPRQNTIVEFTIDDGNKAEMISDTLMKGIALGLTPVHARATGVNPITGQKIIYTEDTVDVKVIAFSGIKILAPFVRLQVGTFIPVTITMLPEQISPLVLGTIEPSLRYSWMAENPGVVKIESIFEKIGVIYDGTDQISVRLKGLSPGRTVLQVNVTIPQSIAACNKKRCTLLTDSIEIEVFTGLMLTSPKGTSGKPILLAPHSQLQLMTNMDSAAMVFYTVMNEDTSNCMDCEKSLSLRNQIVTVSSTGLVQSNTNLGYCTILVISTDNYGLEQTLNIPIKVKPIYHMTLDVVSHWRMSLVSRNLPVGSELELLATFYDETGNIFTAGGTELHVESSRFDLVEMRSPNKNVSVVLSMKKPGSTMLRVWGNGIMRSVDYIKLHAEQVVTPEVNLLVTGDILCLWTPLVSEVPGMWSSSDENLVTIDGESGVGSTVGFTYGHITIQHNLHPAFAFQMQVLPVDTIYLFERQKNLLTNVMDVAPYRMKVLLMSVKHPEKKTNYFKSEHCQRISPAILEVYPIACSVEFTNLPPKMNPSSIFTVNPEFDPNDGLYSCVFYPSGVINPTISKLDTSVILTVKSTGNDVTATSKEIKFLPSVYLDPEVKLDNSYFGTLSIIGNDKVLSSITVTPADWNLLKVYTGQTKKNQVTFNIQMINYNWNVGQSNEHMSLIVEAKTIGQLIKVPVKVRTGSNFALSQCEPSSLTSFWYNYRQILLVLASMVLFFMLTFYAYSQFMQPTINVNMTSNRPMGSQADSSVCTPRTCRNPLPHQCRALAYVQKSRSPNVTRSPVNEPVYGDPSSFYNTSQELRLNKRFI